MSDVESRPPSLFEELKRRRVVRVALVYGTAAFAAIQAADVIFPRVALPDWTVSLVVWLAILGFPLALALAWAFDLTPGGIQRTGDLEDAPTPHAPAPGWIGRRTALVAGGFLLLGLAFGAGWLLRPDARLATAEAAASAASAAGVSVAVLPFADLSAERDQEYLGDGIAEELLNTLRSSEVAVASRTSSFAFKGQSLSLREIAQQLGVDHIVEGSVRRSGNRLRIAAQVIEVRSDHQLWSQTFERDAEDIFRIQDEIAAAVASALRVRLAGSGATAQGTRSTEAYDLYLAGLYHWNQRTPEGLRRAVELFTAATQRDPGFARAWAGLAFTYYVFPEYADYDPDRARALARDAAERAVRLDPASAEARTALGAALHLAGDMDAAIREYDRAIELDPSFPTAHHWRAILLTGKGRVAEGEAGLRHALRLDPASLPIQAFLALNLELQRRTEEALVESEAVVARAPDYRNALFTSFLFAAQLGRAREVRAAPARLPARDRRGSGGRGDHRGRHRGSAAAAARARQGRGHRRAAIEGAPGRRGRPLLSRRPVRAAARTRADAASRGDGSGLVPHHRPAGLRLHPRRPPFPGDRVAPPDHAGLAMSAAPWRVFLAAPRRTQPCSGSPSAEGSPCR